MTVTELGALGYGDPNESISYEKKRALGELEAEVAETTAEFILSGEGMVAINHDDDDLSELAYAGFSYQPATAATLTDGTLRTFVVQRS